MSNSFKCSRIKIQGTASLLNNNISVSNKYFAVCSLKETPTIFVNSIPPGNYKNSVIIKEETDYLDAKYLFFKKSYILSVIASDVIKIFNEEGSKLLTFLKLGQNSNEKEETKLLSQCLVESQDQKDLIACGSTNGMIFLIENVKDLSFKATVSYKHISQIPITALSAYPGTNKLLAGTANGEILTLFLNFAQDSLLINRGILINQSPVTCISAMKYFDKGFITVVGDICGKLTFFEPDDAKKRVEICSHARYISTMQSVLGKEEVISAGEDGYINKWRLRQTPEGELEADLVFSFKVPDQIVTGVALIPNSSNILASIYDGLDVLLVNFD